MLAAALRRVAKNGGKDLAGVGTNTSKWGWTVTNYSALSTVCNRILANTADTAVVRTIRQTSATPLIQTGQFWDQTSGRGMHAEAHRNHSIATSECRILPRSGGT